ncbi:Protein lin-28-like protein A [Bienertia sinuspersici]
MMLWFRIPGLGFSSGGLRCLLDEASSDQLKGYAYNEGIVNIYASHKVDTLEGKGKKPVTTTTPTPTLVNASAANEGNVFVTEQQLGNDGSDVYLQDDGNNVSLEDEDDDLIEDENYKVDPKELKEAYMDKEGDCTTTKVKEKVNEKQAKEKCDATLEEEDNVSAGDVINEEYHYNSENSLASRWAETKCGSTHIVQKAQPNYRNNEERQQSYTQDLVVLQTDKWPTYWTTFEGGYESDQRDSDDEDPFSEEDNEESNTEVQKRRKRVKYPMFIEKTYMKHVELVGLRFTSRSVFKQAIVAYSIQQHKDLIWELTSGPDLEDQTGWQIKSLQPIYEWCIRTFKNRLITEHWLVNEYLDKILRNPFMQGVEIKADMRARYDIVVGVRQCQRAKGRALNVVQIPDKTFWNHEGEGLVLPPNIIKKAPGKKKTVRRRDVDEPTKGKVKYNRKGMPSKCSNCGEPRHYKNKCPLPPQQKLPSFTSDVHTWEKGRKLGSKNRIGRSIPDLVRAEVPTPSQYLKETRKEHEKIIYAGRGTPTTSTPWLEVIVGRGRARKGKGRGRGTPIGTGVIHGEQDQIFFSGSINNPPVVISQGLLSSQPTQQGTCAS